MVFLCHRIVQKNRDLAEKQGLCEIKLAVSGMMR